MDDVCTLCQGATAPRLLFLHALEKDLPLFGSSLPFNQVTYRRKVSWEPTSTPNKSMPNGWSGFIYTSYNGANSNGREPAL